MRIAHVSDCFLPRLGGIEAQVDGLAGVQSSAGHEVVVVTTTPGGQPDRPLRLYRLVGGPFGLALAPDTPARLDSALRWESPDVVHAHVSVVSPLAWAGVGWAVRHGVPAVATMHSMWGSVTRQRHRLTGRVRGPVVVTAVSEAAAAAVRRVASRLAVRVVSNGIDVRRWANPPPTGTPASDGVHVLAVGRFAPRKRPIELLRVLREAARQIDLRATVVGEGGARPAMEWYLRRHRMERVVALPGRLPADAIRELLGEADIFLAPAVLESFGLAALEARTAGVPVIARCGTGIADFVSHGREGLLAPSRRGLVEAVVRLARDEGLRASIASHNRSTPPLERDWAAVARQFDDCYAGARARVVGARC